MMDIRLVRDNPKWIQEITRSKRSDVSIEDILRLDEERRQVQTQLDQWRAQRNAASERVAQYKREEKDVKTLVEENKALSQKIKSGEEKEKELEETLHQKLSWIPNVISPDVPLGEDAAANQIVRTWGERQTFLFKPRTHGVLAPALGLIDFERGAKLSGSGFPLYTDMGARFVRRLVSWMLDLHIERHGYREVYPSVLVRPEAMFGTGQLPKMKEDMYYLEKDNLYLVPTAEVPVTNIFQNEFLPLEKLPLKLTAYTTCFRREAGAAGKETQGITRVHQFDKVELVKFVHPETSDRELELLVQDAEDVLRHLGLEYRVVKLCRGDLSFASAKTYDLEVYAPGAGAFLEVSSCSNFLDFQARRANIRFRDPEKKVGFVHTLNGSGVAIPRIFIALLETYQQENGDVVFPEAVSSILGVEKIVPHRLWE